MMKRFNINALHPRTGLIVENIYQSLILKIFNIIVTFLIVPITLDYLNAIDYGIWLTISSILIWADLFDFGFGNGLRNKLSSTLAENKINLAQIYISTIFVVLSIIIFIVYVIFYICNNTTDWCSILNLKSFNLGELRQVFSIAFLFFCIQFVLRICGTVYYSLQKSAVNIFIIFMSNLVSLIFIIILKAFTTGSLFKVALAYSAAPVFVLSIAFYYLFYVQHKELKPSFKAVRFTYARGLLNKGLDFFIIQLSLLFVYSSSNILISKYLSSTDVTVYNIAMKYFGAFTMIFALLMSPMWGAYADAYVKNDINWIRKAHVKTHFAFYVIVFITILGLLLSSKIFELWIGDSVLIPVNLSILLAVYALLNCFSSIYINLLNGVGNTKIQTILSIINGIFFIPVSIYFIRKYSILGVPIVLCIQIFSNTLLFIYETNKILKFPDCHK